MKPTPYYIEWADAVNNSGWFTRDELEKWIDHESDWIIRECGWVMRDTKECIVFAVSWKPASPLTDEKFCGLHKIPKTWILKKKKLKI